MSPFVAVPTSSRRVELVRVVNEETTQQGHDRAAAFLDGWDECYKALAGRDAWFIQFCDCDQVFGGERPVCGGVWLDWEPTA